MNYSSKAAKAAQLIGKYGAAITVTRPGSTADWELRYDPASMRNMWYYIGSTVPAPASPVATKPTGSDTVFTGVGVMVAWTTHEILGLTGAYALQMGDMKLICQTDTEIVSGDTISMNGRTMQAAEPITKVQPSLDTVIVQEVNCRG